MRQAGAYTEGNMLPSNTGVGPQGLLEGLADPDVRLSQLIGQSDSRGFAHV
jgi:hypothetical protein